MKFKSLIAVACCTALLTGCASLPDGSKKPELTINSVETAENNGISGFNVSFTLKHNSLEPLEVRQILTQISINDIPMASSEEEPDDMEIAPRYEMKLQRFIPANLARNVSGKTVQSPLFYGETNCTVKVMFTKDEEDPFNPQANLSTIINSANK